MFRQPKAAKIRMSRKKKHTMIPKVVQLMEEPIPDVEGGLTLTVKPMPAKRTHRERDFRRTVTAAGEPADYREGNMMDQCA